jgi:hypothetical protein
MTQLFYKLSVSNILITALHMTMKRYGRRGSKLQHNNVSSRPEDSYRVSSSV